jgi:DNA modification methylase
MTPYYEDEAVTLYCGDCRDVLPTLAQDSFDAIVCDPPYGLGFMGKAWDHGVPGVPFWTEAFRVAKPGAHLVAFGGTRTYHRLTCAIEEAGFEIRDCLMWLYGSGFPKSLDVSKAIDKAAGAERVITKPKTRPDGRRAMDARANGYPGSHEAWQRPWKNDASAVIRQAMNTAPATDAARQWAGRGTALKPAWEPIILARKPLAGTVAATVQQFGTGAINVDVCRIAGVPPSVPQPAFNSPTGRTYGMKTGEGRNGEMSHASGRWPANLLLDAESAAALDAQTGEQKSGVAVNRNRDGSDNKNPNGNAYGTYKNMAGADVGYGDSGGGASRFFYTAKADAEDRNDGCEALDKRSAGDVTDRKDGTAGLQSPRAGAGRTSGNRNTHPTVKPTDLMRWLVRLVTPPGGVVLDPFMGSGSTGRGAVLEGARFVGIELTEEYLPIARARIQAAQRVQRLPFATDDRQAPAIVAPLGLFEEGVA